MTKATYRMVYLGLQSQRSKSPSPPRQVAQQWAGMATGTAKRELTSGTARREGIGNARRLLRLKTYPSDELPPARPQCLSLPKQCHQLGINYSNS